jgi:hypothetical protein
MSFSFFYSPILYVRSAVYAFFPKKSFAEKLAKKGKKRYTVNRKIPTQ